MIKLKFTLDLIRNLIVNNIGKTILLVIIAVSFYYAGSFDRYPDKKHIDKVLQIDNGYVYLYKKITNDEISYEGMFYTTPQVLDKESNITIIKYNGFNILFWIIFAIGIVVFIISVADEGWDYNELYHDSFSAMIDCEIENGKFIYSMMGRLIGTSDEKIVRRRICDRFYVYGFRDLKSCPKYKTKSKHRESLLNELGI